MRSILCMLIMIGYSVTLSAQERITLLFAGDLMQHTEQIKIFLLRLISGDHHINNRLHLLPLSSARAGRKATSSFPRAAHLILSYRIFLYDKKGPVSGPFRSCHSYSSASVLAYLPVSLDTLALYSFTSGET